MNLTGTLIQPNCNKLLDYHLERARVTIKPKFDK
jgi:hypothetical protein